MRSRNDELLRHEDQASFINHGRCIFQTEKQKLKKSFKHIFYYTHTYTRTRTTEIEAEILKEHSQRFHLGFFSAMRLSHFGNCHFKKSNRVRIHITTMKTVEEWHILVCTSNLVPEDTLIN